MRTATVTLIALLALLPLAGAVPSTTYNADTPCGAPAQPFNVVNLDFCGLHHEGTVTLLGCTTSACTLSISGYAHAFVPQGAASVSTLVTGDAGPVTVCSSSAVGLQTQVWCQGRATITLALPQSCRIFSLDTSASGDLVVGGALHASFSVCKDNTLHAL